MERRSFSLEELAAWAALGAARLPVNPATVAETFERPQEVFRASASHLRQTLRWTQRQLDRVGKTEPSRLLPFLEHFLKAGGRLLPYPHSDYPKRLREIASPPFALWCQGQAEAVSTPLIGIVGSRRPTRYGLDVARVLAAELVRARIGVVSGGAYGIDAAAHRGVLDENGTTVAILGTGIDLVYPAVHRGMFEEIAQTGACVTEFAPGEPPKRENFPVRNRLISGMSLGIVVVEAGEKSGALITTRYALEQDREVFAVPGSIFSEMSVGPNRLLRNGAKLVSGVEDILEEITGQMAPDGVQGMLPFERQMSELPPLSGDAETVFGLLGGSSSSVDDLIERSGLTAARMLEILMKLELSGHIVQLPGQRYTSARAVQQRPYPPTA